MRTSILRQAAAAAGPSSLASSSTTTAPGQGMRLLTAHLQPASLPTAVHASFERLPNVRPPEPVAASAETKEQTPLELPRGLNLSTSPDKLRPKSLFDHLAALPNNGVGTRVLQTRWLRKGLNVPAGKPLAGPQSAEAIAQQDEALCYWQVTRARIRRAESDGRPHGVAWGCLYWRGKRVTPKGKDEKITGSLKYAWDVAR